MDRIDIIDRFDFIQKLISDKDSSMVRSKRDMKGLEEWIQIIKVEFPRDFLSNKIQYTNKEIVHLSFAFARVEEATIDGTPYIKIFIISDGGCIVIGTSDFTQH